MSENSEFWQVRLKVIQAPKPLEVKDQIYKEHPGIQEEEHFRSFLNDPLSSLGINSHCLELTVKKKLKWIFYTGAKTRRKALRTGHAWLSSLKSKFPGLDGVVEARLIKMTGLKNCERDNLKEIILPEDIPKNKINIIERFINSFYFNTSHEVSLYILWTRNPLKNNLVSPEENNYSIRIFLRYANVEMDFEEQTKFEGILDFLFLDIENQRGERVRIRETTEFSLFDIISGDVFKDSQKVWTRLIKDEVNFDFPMNLPLPTMPFLRNENVRYIDLSNRFINNAISIGNHVKEGVVTSHKTYVPINKLPQDCAIFGKSGSGKTYFLARFIEELSSKFKRAGILILNVAKEFQEGFYRDFTVIKYSDDAFNIPYFTKDAEHDFKKRLQEAATYICASLGLKNVFEKIIYRSMVGFMELDGKLPDNFYYLLRGVGNYMRKNPYGAEEQSNLMQAFRNRMNTFNEDKIQEVLKLSEGLPEFIKNWLKGENIFLDLSMCSKFIKLLIVNALFQIIRTVTKDIEAEELKNLIVIDETHSILENQIRNFLIMTNVPCDESFSSRYCHTTY